MKRLPVVRVFLIILLIVILSLPVPQLTKFRLKITSFIISPVKLANSIFRFLLHYSDYSKLIEENRKFKEENLKLNLKLSLIKELKKENESLRELLSLKKRLTFPTITAMVIGRDFGVFSGMVILDCGRKDGIRENLAVISSEGLVGKTVEIGEDFSKVMLISNPNSRVAAKIEKTGEQGLLFGFSKDNYLEMRYISQEAEVSVNDVVITSGLGGVFPGGIVIGKVGYIQEDDSFKSAFIKPAVNFSRLEQVLVLTFPAR